MHTSFAQLERSRELVLAVIDTDFPGAIVVNLEALHSNYMKCLFDEQEVAAMTAGDMIRASSEREPGAPGDRGRHKRIARRVLDEFGVSVTVANIKKTL